MIDELLILNRALKPHGLWFPVDISTASRATIGGMAGNNSCGGRSLRYGTMRDNVLSIEALLADGTLAHFGPLGGSAADVPAPIRPMVADLLAIGAREADEIAARFPKVQRRVGGYNLDALVQGQYLGRNDVNLAHLLVGSEGTLGFSTRIELKLSPLLGRRAVGACHFGSFYEAMNAAQHIVRPGGRILLIAECAEGPGAHEFCQLLKRTRTDSEYLESIANSPVIVDQWQLEKLALVTQKADVLFYTPGLPAEYHDTLWGQIYDSPQAALHALFEGLRPHARIALMPEGPYVLAKVAATAA